MGKLEIDIKSALIDLEKLKEKLLSHIGEETMSLDIYK